ncbi:MAG: DUF547 domain-containing protein [Deltaproteobacteria bacterium]|nr:DUF547 domain-containing protein [Deltaproteobacteria bacterium]
MTLKARLLPLLVLLLLAFPVASPAFSEPDNGVYAGLLDRHNKKGVLDYKGLKSEEALLDSYLAVLARVKPDELPRDSQLAFYINLYNASTIKLVLSEYPGIKSIKDVGGFFGPWKKKFVRLGGKTVTLGHIEHQILRPRFADPRVHFALVCASRGCPPLLGAPYEGSLVNRQLDEVVTGAVNDPARTYVKDGRIYVSRIFKWFSGDFGKDPIGFVERYARGHLKEAIAGSRKDLKIEYLEYDWSLNGR